MCTEGLSESRRHYAAFCMGSEVTGTLLIWLCCMVWVKMERDGGKKAS